MTDFQLKIARVREEMERGRGGDRIHNQPTPLEPLFIPFSYDIRAAHQNSHQSGDDPWNPDRLPTDRYHPAFLTIRASKEDRILPELAEQFILSAASSSTLSFEIICRQRKIAIQIVTSRNNLYHVMGCLRSLYPNSEVFETDDLLRRGTYNQFVVKGYRLRESHFFPIRADFKVDPYGSLFGAISSLAESEFAGLQALFAPVRHNWRENILTAAKSEFDPAKSAFHDLPNLPKLADEKAGKPLYAVSARVIASSNEIVGRLEGFWRQFDGENGFIALRCNYPRSSATERTTYSTGMLLNSKEVAALIHMPSSEVLSASVEMAGRGTAPPPMATRKILIPLGTNYQKGTETSAGIPEEELVKHTIVVGKSGEGKSTLIVHQLTAMAESGHSFIFIDPAGDTARILLGLIPQYRKNDVVFFDPADTEFPPGFNVLESVDDRDRQLLCSDLLASLENYYRDAWGPRMAMILRNDINLLLNTPGEKTLLDVPRVLMDKHYREALLDNVDDPTILNFWRNIYANLSKGAAEPVLNKLSEFLDNPLVRNIVAQPNLVDINRIMQENKLVIASLSRGLLGDDAANLLGSFLLARCRIATLSRASLPPQERPLTGIVIDEAHNYASTRANANILVSMLSEARKYRVALVLATQFLSQLHQSALAAILGNVSTIITFRVGIPDAHTMERELGKFTIEDLLNLNVGECVVRMGRTESSFNVKVPPPKTPDTCLAEGVIKISRDKYCQPRKAVEQAIRDDALSVVAEDSNSDGEALSADELRFLEGIRQNPDRPTTLTYKALGLSNYSGNKLKQSLLKRGLLCEVRTKLGRKKRIAKFLIPSQTACRRMGLPPYHGRGGLIHQYLQSFVCQQAEANGYNVQVEHRIPGADESIDVLIERQDVTTAVEIAVSSTGERELQNIKKCLAAKYDNVLALFVDASVLADTSDLASNILSREELSKVRLGLVNDFSYFL